MLIWTEVKVGRLCQFAAFCWFSLPGFDARQPWLNVCLPVFPTKLTATVSSSILTLLLLWANVALKRFHYVVYFASAPSKQGNVVKPVASSWHKNNKLQKPEGALRDRGDRGHSSQGTQGRQFLETILLRSTQQLKVLKKLLKLKLWISQWNTRTSPGDASASKNGQHIFSTNRRVVFTNNDYWYFLINIFASDYN